MMVTSLFGPAAAAAGGAASWAGAGAQNHKTAERHKLIRVIRESNIPGLLAAGGGSGTVPRTVPPPAMRYLNEKTSDVATKISPLSPITNRTSRCPPTRRSRFLPGSPSDPQGPLNSTARRIWHQAGSLICGQDFGCIRLDRRNLAATA